MAKGKEKNNVKQKGRGGDGDEEDKALSAALISRLFPHCALAEMEQKKESSTSGRKCLLFRNVI